MTIWTPDLAEYSGPRYKRIAAAIGDAVRKGALAPGDRLPTHRDLAYNLNVTVGTVTRAYKEAERSGLLDGEVGRGTFVKELETPESKFVITEEKKTNIIDLSMNFPPAGNRAEAFRSTLEQLTVEPNLATLLDYHAAGGLERHRMAGAKLMGMLGHKPDPSEILITNGAQHGVAVSLMSLCKAGDTVIAEELTYPVTKILATQLGLKLHGVAMDQHGILPDALESACQTTGARVLYFMPSFNNPTGAYMPLERRREIAAVGEKYGLTIIDDDIFGYMEADPAPPMSAIAPDISCHLISTKLLAPGLRIGYLRVPEKLIPVCETAIRTTGWMASPILGEVAARWINDGTANRTFQWHRTESAKRRKFAMDMLGEFGLHARETGPYHVWFPIPDPWHQEEFIAEAKRRGVKLIGGDTFAVGRNRAPHAIRLCLGCSHTRDDMEEGLKILQDILSKSALARLAIV